MSGMPRSGPSFSPDGRHLWWTVEQRGMETCYIDGRQQQESGLIRDVVFSPDCGRFAYAALGKKSHVVLDGVPGPDYDWVSEVPKFLSNDTLEFVALKPGALVRVRFEVTRPGKN